MQAFREWLRATLDERGWTNADLERASGVSNSIIWRWLADRPRRPSDTNLKRIAPALGVPYEDLAKMCGYSLGEPIPVTDSGKAEWNALYDQMHPETRSTVVPMVRAAANASETGTANHSGVRLNRGGRKAAATDIISESWGLVLARSTAVLAWICRPLHPLGVPTAATA